MTERRTAILYGAVVAVIGMLVFVPAVTGSWIYDDHLLIPDNPYAHSFQWWPRWWMSDFFDISEELQRMGVRNSYWRPLISTSYALDWQLGGGSPVMFHVTNLVLHGTAGALSFVVLRRWIGATWPAAIAVLLFVVHPTKAESVAWISGRTDIVCMIALLLASEGIARRRRGKPGGIALEVFGTLFAYASKEQAIVLPAFAAIEAWVVAERPPIDRAVFLRLVRAAVPQAIVAIVYLALRHFLLPISAPSIGAGIPMGDHAQAIAESIGRFIMLTFAPHDLSIQQGLIHIESGGPAHSTGYVVLGVIALVALLVAAVALRRRYPFVTVGIAFYLITLAPTSNIIYTQLETLISERFLYLPLLGFAIVVGFVLARTKARWPVALALAVAALWSAQSFDRATDYSDETAFWARERELHPRSPTARRNAINRALRERRYRSALVQTLELTRTDVTYQDLPVAYQVAQLLANLTPDLDRATLEKIDTFCRDLLDAKPPSATLAAGPVVFTIKTTSRIFKRYLGYYRLSLIASRAHLQSRLGNDAAAVELAKQALQDCARCTNIVTTAALVIARAGFYEDALAILAQAEGHIPDEPLEAVRAMVVKAQRAQDQAQGATGPLALQARAFELAALELWGRAYAVLAPHKDEIKQAPRFAKGFAELAVRAGETAVAREVLAATMSPSEIDATIAQWMRVMGWTE